MFWAELTAKAKALREEGVSSVQGAESSHREVREREISVDTQARAQVSWALQDKLRSLILL